MVLVHWGYALACTLAVFLVWLYVGTANPAVKPGLAAEFHFFRWLKNVFFRCIGYVYEIRECLSYLYMRKNNYRKRVYEYEQIVVTPVLPGVDVRSAQLNEDNTDFSSRRRYHQSAVVQGHMVNMDYE